MMSCNTLLHNNAVLSFVPAGMATNVCICAGAGSSSRSSAVAGKPWHWLPDVACADAMQSSASETFCPCGFPGSFPWMQSAESRGVERCLM